MERSSQRLSGTPTASVVSNPGCRSKTFKAPLPFYWILVSLPWLLDLWDFSLFLFQSLFQLFFFLSVTVIHSLSPSPPISLSIISCSFSILLTFLSITSPNSLTILLALLEPRTKKNRNPEAWLIHKSISIWKPVYSFRFIPLYNTQKYSSDTLKS